MLHQQASLSTPALLKHSKKRLNEGCNLLLLMCKITHAVSEQLNKPSRRLCNDCTSQTCVPHFTCAENAVSQVPCSLLVKAHSKQLLTVPASWLCLPAGIT
jgi:hypothetical protein